MLAIDTVATQDSIRILKISGQVLQSSVMEFVRRNTCTGIWCFMGRWGPQALACVFYQHIAPALWAIIDDDVTWHCTDHLVFLFSPLNAARQVHESAALRVCGHAARQRLPDISEQALIHGQGRQVSLRKSATNEQAVHLRQPGIAERVERNQLSTGVCKGCFRSARTATKSGMMKITGRRWSRTSPGMRMYRSATRSARRFERQGVRQHRPARIVSGRALLR